MKRYCVVRFDDVCPTMNWEQFDKALSLMREYDTKPLLGVIPDNHDIDQMIDAPRIDFWDYIKELQHNGYEIAMHGYTHVYDQQNPKTIVCGRKHSEFAGNTYEKQFDKIKKGKEILESHGIFTDVFFAPAHTYDKNTLKALYANGFRYISDGLSKKPYVQEGIICIPCRSGGVPRVKRNGIYVAVNHTNEWLLPNKEKDYDALIFFLKNNKNLMTTFSELKKMPPGIFFYQKLNERVHLLKSRMLRFVKKMMLRRRMAK